MPHQRQAGPLATIMTASKYSVLFVLFFVTGCDQTSITKMGSDINFKDTLYESHILSVEGIDTIKKYITTYFSPTDPKIDTSNFFYTACEMPCLDSNTYKIFFQREQVVTFCDSMLNALPTYKNQGDDTIYFERMTYEKIRSQASNNNREGTILFGEVSTLLDRFHPLIVNPVTDDVPKYVIISYIDIRRSRVKVYKIRNANGDTTTLTNVTIRPVELEVF